MFALWLLVLMLVSVFVVDVGNWYTHKRHLQTQADAAAFAGGDAFAFPCVDSSIEAAARSYGGASTVTPNSATVYNSQLGGASRDRIHAILNSSKYYNENPSQAAAAGGFGDLGSPCSAKFIDVRMTESSLPWYFLAGMFVPAINAHARVSLLQESTKSGAIPVAVPDPGFAITAAAVEFVDEDTGTSLGSAPLTATGSRTYSNASAPVGVDMSGRTHVGVIIKLSGATPPPSPLTCGQPLVLCFDLTGPAGTPPGMLFIHGYPSAGYSTAAGEPTVKSVTLFTPGGASGCANGYFFAILSGSCQIGVQADVTFSDATGNKRSVSATLSDYQSDYSEQHDLNNSTGSTWVSTGNGQGPYFNIPANEGPVKVTLSWTKKAGSYKGNPCTASSPCSGNWGEFVFQRTLSGSDIYSGPIQAAVLYESGGTPSSNSFQNDGASTVHNLYLDLQLQPALGYADSVSSPPVYLRVEGSQNQTIDCDPNLPNLRQELDFGCKPQYTVDKVVGGKFSVDCTTWPTSNNQWNPPNYGQPWPCVSVQTGGAGGQVGPGIEDRMNRLAGTTCPTNHWSSFPNFAQNDPRLISTVLTPFGTFGGSGNANIPVTGFAEFYITGWAKSGTGSKKPQADCQGDDVPPGADYIVGHFVHYVDTLGGGTGTDVCDPTILGTCVPVLTQ
jgi:Putative Flp pilus-assembly TadE/G-like